MPPAPPSGITPPAPGLHREEPDFWIEDDIPSDDGGPAAGERSGGEERPARERQGERE